MGITQEDINNTAFGDLKIAFNITISKSTDNNIVVKEWIQDTMSISVNELTELLQLVTKLKVLNSIRNK
jgi:hypothetical protein